MLKESIKAKERKENRWMELTSLIVNEIELENDMAYCRLEDYKSGIAFDEDDDSKILYGFSEEEIWDKLFLITDTVDYETLEEKFLNCRWCNWENALVFELKNGNKFMALRL
jgi:hypothetical protein